MINADDAATAVVAALDVPGGTYDIVDDEPLTRRGAERGVGGSRRAPSPVAGAEVGRTEDVGLPRGVAAGVEPRVPRSNDLAAVLAQRA